MYGNVNGGGNVKPLQTVEQKLWDGASITYYILPELKLVIAYIFIGTGVIQANTWYSYAFPDEVGVPAADREAPLADSANGISSARAKVDNGTRRMNLYTGNLQTGAKPAGTLMFPIE